MLKFLDNFFSRLSWFSTLHLFWVTVTGFAVWYFNLLNQKITLSLWQLLLLFALPHWVYFVFRLVYLSHRRTYKTGDAVSVVADNRKFIVIRYHFWRPQHLLCKVQNGNNCISVHQKYASTYVEPETHTLNDMINTILQNKKQHPAVGRIGYL